MDGKIAKSYELKVSDKREGAKNLKGEALDHGFAERTTFVITKDGKVAATIGNMKPADNVLKALETVQNLSGKKPTA
jgi:peroxiredoxin Q/BCP